LGKIYEIKCDQLLKHLGNFWELENMLEMHYEHGMNTLRTLCALGGKTLGTSKSRKSSKPPSPPPKEKTWAS
jgi:hypothetical protein